MVILIIMVAGFATLYAFAGTTVLIAGHDAASSAGSRSNADTLLAGEFGAAGAGKDVTISWNGDALASTVSVDHASVDVPMARGSGGDFDIYRRPAAVVPILEYEARVQPSIFGQLDHYGGATEWWPSQYVNNSDTYAVYFAQTQVASLSFFDAQRPTRTMQVSPTQVRFEGKFYIFDRLPPVRPGYEFVHYVFDDTGEKYDKALSFNRHIAIRIIWRCLTCGRLDCYEPAHSKGDGKPPPYVFRPA